MGKVLITGPGRSGTTLLVELLDQLGMDTGRDRLRYFSDGHAGLEDDPRRSQASVVKRPLVDIEELRRDGVELDHVIVPLRELDQATLSRKLRSASTWAVKVRGGLDYTRNPLRQRGVLAERTYRIIERCEAFGISVTVIAFPRFAVDVDYAWDRLGPITGAEFPNFAFEWHKTIDPDRIRTTPLHPSTWTDGKLLLKWGINAARVRMPIGHGSDTPER